MSTRQKGLERADSYHMITHLMVRERKMVKRERNGEQERQRGKDKGGSMNGPST